MSKLIDGRPLDADGHFIDKPSAISTWTGRQVDPLALEPSDICIDDIAHALARTCRYGGHVSGYLSVARHSIWVSEYVEPLGDLMALTGLLHDAAEAYLGDMPRPLKKSPDMALFQEADERADRIIAQVFGLPNPLPEEVIEADRQVLLEIEIPVPMGARHTYYGIPSEDEQDFLARFFSLRMEM